MAEPALADSGAVPELSQTEIDTARLGNIISTLQSATLGPTLIEFAEIAEAQVLFDPDLDCAGYMSRSFMGGFEIVLNSSLSDEVMTVVLAHELRHIEQSIVTGFSAYQLSEAESVRLTRIFEADASAYTAGVAHELHQVTGSPAYLDALAMWREDDIAAAFARAASPEQGWAQDLQPFAAAFDQWFEGDWRTKGYDEDARSAYRDAKDSILSDIFNAVPVTLNAQNLASIGDIGPGLNYLRDTGRSADVLLSPRYGA